MHTRVCLSTVLADGAPEGEEEKRRLGTILCIEQVSITYFYFFLSWLYNHLKAAH